MGYPIKTNIFRAGSDTQKYFARFPIQIIIFFSPSDGKFKDYLKSNFAHLDRATGNGLAFFTVLDPSEEWINERGNRAWWDDYQRELGSLSYNADDRVLLREIARLFGVPWHSFPVIVASPNLWRAEYIICPTSVHHLEAQLSELATLSSKYSHPNIGHIASTLEYLTGVQPYYQAPNELIRRRLDEFYDILQTYPSRYLTGTNFRYSLRHQLYSVERNLELMRRNSQFFSTSLTEIDEHTDQEANDALIEDAAGRLVAPASVAVKVLHDLRHTTDLPEMLDEESAVMIETAITVGNLLEGLANNILHGLGPLVRRRPDSEIGNKNQTALMDIDFTPGTQGAWKAFELEINLSLIQAARLTVDVPMPRYFTLYDPELPPERGIVNTGKRNNIPYNVDINQRDWSDRAKKRHKFITLGDAFQVIRSMSAAETDKLYLLIQQILGSPLPEGLFNAWNLIVKIRNRGSHVHKLNQSDYKMVMHSALNPDNLTPLMKIKHQILNGNLQLQ